MKTINIKGPIISNNEKWIYDWFGADATCPKDVITALPEDGTEALVIINSGGGYIDEGNEIYTTLKSYEGKVMIDIIKAASAASVIAMSGDYVRITPVGQIMIHNVKCGAQGDYHKMDQTSEVLQKTNRAIVSAYALKTGMPEKDLLKMMDSETWLNAEEAKEKGFVDEILFQEDRPLKLLANCDHLLPVHVVNKMQNMKYKNEFQGIEDNINISRENLVNIIRKEVEKVLNNQKSKSESKGTDRMERFLFY